MISAAVRTESAELRVSLITEGTYPYVVGGVSTWCHDLITGLADVQWDVIPITAGGIEREPLFDIPSNAELVDGIELWSPGPKRSLRTRLSARRSVRGGLDDLPAELAQLVLSPEYDTSELVQLLARCKESPSTVSAAFRTGEAWNNFVDVLYALTHSTKGDLFAPVPMTTLDAAKLWQTMFWLALTSTIEIPRSDVVLCTAAGWPAVIASSAKFNFGTPVIVAEHGVYVREAYLESVRTNPAPGHQFAATRLATGLSRLAYAIADRVTPVCDGHRPWEEILGADPSRIDTIVNGVEIPDTIAEPCEDRTVVSVGRVDPLKDIATCLRAARVVCDRDETVQFLHYGPVTEVNQAYYEMCLQLHRELELGDRFRFMGGTSDPRGAMRNAAMYLSTSISEGLPLSVLEAMTEARPVVATDVGGCADLVTGCGVLAAAGDPHGIAGGILTLLGDPSMANLMGRRGYRRARRRFSKETQLDNYRRVLTAAAA